VTDNGNEPATLPAAMTGRASPAKAALGDKPVFAYISSLPQPQRSIAERVDALAAETLPALQRSVKWGMAWYGVGDGWCFSRRCRQLRRSGWARTRAAWTSSRWTTSTNANSRPG